MPPPGDPVQRLQCSANPADRTVRGGTAVETRAGTSNFHTFGAAPEARARLPTLCYPIQKSMGISLIYFYLLFLLFSKQMNWPAVPEMGRRLAGVPGPPGPPFRAFSSPSGDTSRFAARRSPSRGTVTPLLPHASFCEAGFFSPKMCHAQTGICAGR